MNRTPKSLRSAPRQRGIALVMALVFLLLLTLIGIAALGTTSLEEKMAHNVKDRNLAFQAAESALIVAENWIYTQIGKPVFPNNPIGLYTPVTSDTDADPNWKDATWSTNNVVTYPSTPGQTVSGSLGKIQNQPKYIIEDMGEIEESGGSLTFATDYKGSKKGATTVLRITARGTGGTNAAVVMVQSTYSRPF